MKLIWKILFGLGLFLLLLLCMRGCGTFRNPPREIFTDMVRQSRVNPQAPSNFFADGRGSRPPVAGTVPFGYAMPRRPSEQEEKKHGPYLDIDFGNSNSYRDTGKFGAQWGQGIPLEVNAVFMQRGRERFSIYCAVCHGATGRGDGIVTKYGLVGVANLHLKRIRSLPDGQIFDVITRGKNLMMPLGDKISISERWAIIAYLRALQRSQQTDLKDVPISERIKLEVHP